MRLSEMSIFKKSKTAYYTALFALFAVAVFLRLMNMIEAPVFVHEAPVIVSENFFYEANGTLHHALIYIIRAVFGDGLFAMRFPSLICDIGICFFVWLTAKYLWNDRAAVFSLFFYSMNGFAICMGRYCRFYPLGGLFVTASSYIMLRALDAKGKTADKWWLWYFIVSVCAVASMVLSIPVTAAQLLYILYAMPNKRKAFAVTVIAVVVTAFVLGILWNADVQALHRFYYSPFTGDALTMRIMGFWWIFDEHIIDYFLGRRSVYIWVAFLLLIFLSWRVSRNNHRIFIPMLSLLPFLSMVIYSFEFKSILNRNNTFLLLPAYAWVTGLLISKIPRIFQYSLLIVIIIFNEYLLLPYYSIDGPEPKYELLRAVQMSNYSRDVFCRGATESLYGVNHYILDSGMKIIESCSFDELEAIAREQNWHDMIVWAYVHYTDYPAFYNVLSKFGKVKAYRVDMNYNGPLCMFRISGKPETSSSNDNISSSTKIKPAESLSDKKERH
ncbi:MAG: glycosyltransferase family 39 protein [bacterium]|nr:glycosyltransferase family 39 protein [bacterium]